MKAFLTIFILICLIFISAQPAMADVGLNINYPLYNLDAAENLYYGYMTNTSAGSLMLLQSPAGTDKFRVTQGGDIRTSGICDENENNCHDISKGWASLATGDGYIGNAGTHTAGGQLNISVITGSGLQLRGTGGGWVEAKSGHSSYGLRISDYDSDAWGNIDTNDGYMAIGYNNANGPLFIDDDDQVGIGTTNPAYKLDVDGTTSIGSNLAGGIDVLNLHNNDIYGVNMLKILDPGKGFLWDGGASQVRLYVIDDATDSILYTNLNYVIDGKLSISTTDTTEKIMVNGWIGRTAHNNGALVGGHNNIGASDQYTNPIYTIGWNYKPAATTLGNMYGIGYADNNDATFISSTAGGAGNGWGMYVASDGDARIFLNGSTGGAYFSGNVSTGTTDPRGYRLRIPTGGNARVDGRLYLGTDNLAYIEAVPGDDVVRATNLDSAGLAYVRGQSGDGLYVSTGGASIYSNVGINRSQTSDSYRLAMGGHIHMNNYNVNYVNEFHFNDNVRFLGEGNDNYLRLRYGDAVYGGIQFFDGNDLTQGYVYSESDGILHQFGLLDSDGTWAVRIGTNNYLNFYVDNAARMNITDTNGIFLYPAGGYYVSIGSRDTTWSHFYTSAPKYYFDKPLNAGNGVFASYNENLSLQAPFGSTRMTITTAGNVGIGLTAPTQRLDVVGHALFTTGVYVGEYRVTHTAGVGDLCANGSGSIVGCFSDERLKENIKTIDKPLEKLKKLRGVYFNWRKDNEEGYAAGGDREIGLIAQEVEEVLPEVVGENQDGYKTMDYSKLTSFLIEVNKKQEELIGELTREVEKLEAN